MTCHFLPQRPITLGQHKDSGYVSITETITETERLTPAECTEDMRRSYEVALHAKRHDKPPKVAVDSRPCERVKPEVIGTDPAIDRGLYRGLAQSTAEET